MLLSLCGLLVQSTPSGILTATLALRGPAQPSPRLFKRRQLGLNDLRIHG
jgi:hypothetical protein